MNMIREVWAPMYGYEDEYMISTHGRVLSRPRTARTQRGVRTVPGKIVKTNPNSRGYLSFSAYRRGTRKTELIHQCVLKTFVGPPPEAHEACHWDDDKTNNRLDNLRWATSSDNHRDTVRNGNHHNAKKTHCKRGHEYDEQNTYQKSDGRGCRTCKREDSRRYYHEAKRQPQKQNQEGVA